jgi:hypothetical protein
MQIGGLLTNLVKNAQLPDKAKSSEPTFARSDRSPEPLGQRPENWEGMVARPTSSSLNKSPRLKFKSKTLLRLGDPLLLS